MRVVLDTNVIVSGLNFPGNERLVLDLATRSRFELYLSEFILREVIGVLRRKFGWSEESSNQAIEMLQNAATVIQPSSQPEVLDRDHPDNLILACAEDVSADYLVTGDRRHLLPLGAHGTTKILNAPRLLSVLEGQSSQNGYNSSATR